MNRIEIINFIRRERNAQIPVLQKKFGISYRDAKSIVDEMVKKGELVYNGGIRYDYAYVTGDLRRSYVSPDFRKFRQADQREIDNIKRTMLRDYYDDNTQKPPEDERKDVFNIDFDVNDEDELRKKALELCIRKNSASASLIQRSFPIGYIRACKLVDWMEEQGYVSAPDGPFARKILITEAEFNKKFLSHAYDLDDDDEDDDDYDEDPFAALEEFQERALKLIEENERKAKTEKMRLADVIKKIAIKREEDEAPPAKKPVKSEPADKECLPAHPSWTDNFEFIRTVRRNIEAVIKSDRTMGVQGAIKSAKNLLSELKERGDNRMAEVYERVVFEFEHTSPYQYAKLKKKYFV